MAVYYLCSGFGMEHSFVNKFGELLAEDLESRKNMVIIPCTENQEFAKSFYIGPDLVDSKKLLAASRNRGEVYFLQNKTETDTLKISFIRAENRKKEFVSMYDGKVWKATKEGYELMEEYVR